MLLKIAIHPYFFAYLKVVLYNLLFYMVFNHSVRCIEITLTYIDVKSCAHQYYPNLSFLDHHQWC